MSRPPDRPALNTHDEALPFGKFSTIAVGIGLTVLMILFMLVIAGAVGDVAIDETYDTDIEDFAEFDEDGVASLTDGGIETVNEVRLTAGYAAEFSGDHERYVAADIGTEWADGDWSVLTAANLSADANQGGAYRLFADADEEVIVQYENESWVAYTENDFGEDGVVSVDANPDDWEQVMVSYDAGSDELSITANGSTDTTTLDFDDAELMLAADWRGELDELRVIDDAVSSGDRTQYADDPVRVLESESDHVARLMFNEGSGTETRVYYDDSSASLVGVEFTDSPYQGPDLIEGTDYSVDASAGEVHAIDDSETDGAPVVWANYDGDSDSSVLSAIAQGDTAFMLLAVGVLILPLAAVVVFLLTILQNAGITFSGGGRQR